MVVVRVYAHQRLLPIRIRNFRWMVDPMNAVNAVRVLESPEFRTVAGDVDRLSGFVAIRSYCR